MLFFNIKNSELILKQYIGQSFTKLWCKDVLAHLKKYNYDKCVNCVVTGHSYTKYKYFLGE